MYMLLKCRSDNCVGVYVWEFVYLCTDLFVFFMQYECELYYIRVCVCACTYHLPLQFFAILNMLAALAYISQASSTLWFPL